MADFSDPLQVKKGTGSVYPISAIDAAGGPDRIEHMLTPAMLRSRFLFGIPLVSPLDPKQKITDKELRDYIKRAVNQVEMDVKTTISPVLHRVRLPFDPRLYYNNIWCEVAQKPINRLIRFAICSASYVDTPGAGDRYPSGAQIFQIPSQWVDMSYAAQGKIFVNPINPAFTAVGFTEAAASSGATILQFIGIQGWVPAYWTLEVEIGFCSQEGNVPVIVNEAVGAKAAILVLDNLIPLFRISNQSLNIDGQGQSTTDDLQRLLKQKRDDLLVEYKAQTKAMKTYIGATFFASNV